MFSAIAVCGMRTYFQGFPPCSLAVSERELKPEATIKDYLIVAPEGARKALLH